MKRYKLKKDLPTFKAGEMFHANKNGNLVSDERGVVAYMKRTLDKFPNILEDWFEEDDGAWKPVFGEHYYYMDIDGFVRQGRWDNEEMQEEMLEIGNVFKTKEEAEKAVKWLEAFATLRRDTKGFTADWEKPNDKYIVLYNRSGAGFIASGGYFPSGGKVLGNLDPECEVIGNVNENKELLG